MSACEAVVVVDSGRPDGQDGMSFTCEGTCARGDCRMGTREEADGKRRTTEAWCGCDGKEPERCHLVFRQVYEDGNLVRECVLCRGTCEKQRTTEHTCQVRIHALVLTQPDAGECADIHATRWIRTTYRCECRAA